MFTRRKLIVESAVAATVALSNKSLAKAKEPAMFRCALDFLSSLNPELKAKAVFPFNSDERMNWHYIPKERKGVSWKELSAEQQTAAKTLVLAGLSKAGYAKVEAIRQLETVLHAMENNNPTRDPEKYHLTIFGEPAAKGTWGWRFEGHHVSLQWTIRDGKVMASSPQFLGTNPAEVREGPKKGTRVLAAEEDLGRALVKSLTAEQRKEAILSETAPGDVLTAASRKASIQEDKGISYSKLSKEQQGLFISLLMEYANVQSSDISKKRIEAVRKTGLNQVKFAWMGGLERGQPHYYRIQGATFLVEYDNTQNNANHIHAVWRDFAGDFGADLIALHYDSADHAHGHDA